VVAFYRAEHPDWTEAEILRAASVCLATMCRDDLDRDNNDHKFYYKTALYGLGEEGSEEMSGIEPF